MKLTAKDFIEAGEIAFIGYSRNEKSFSRSVYGDLVKAGLKVYPVNVQSFIDSGVKVYGSVSELPVVPKSAYVIVNPSRAGKVIADLAAAGIRRVWFQESGSRNAEILAQCESSGLEAFIGCPRMYLSDGFIHRLHGFFAGAKR